MCVYFWTFGARMINCSISRNKNVANFIVQPVLFVKLSHPTWYCQIVHIVKRMKLSVLTLFYDFIFALSFSGRWLAFGWWRVQTKYNKMYDNYLVQFLGHENLWLSSINCVDSFQNLWSFTSTIAMIQTERKSTKMVWNMCHSFEFGLVFRRGNQKEHTVAQQHSWNNFAKTIGIFRTRKERITETWRARKEWDHMHALLRTGRDIFGVSFFFFLSSYSCAFYCQSVFFPYWILLLICLDVTDCYLTGRTIFWLAHVHTTYGSFFIFFFKEFFIFLDSIEWIICILCWMGNICCMYAKTNIPWTLGAWYQKYQHNTI